MLFVVNLNINFILPSNLLNLIKYHWYSSNLFELVTNNKNHRYFFLRVDMAESGHPGDAIVGFAFETKDNTFEKALNYAAICQKRLEIHRKNLA